MGILKTVENNQIVFTLTTKSTEYQMKVNEYGILLHSYYGKKIDYFDMSYAISSDRGLSFSPQLPENDVPISLTELPQEVSTFGMGDFRDSQLNIRQSDGSLAFEPRYFGYEIVKGKYSIPQLPAFYDEDGETLIITLKDKIYDIYVHLYYGIIEDKDMICRSLRIENKTDKSIYLEKALSVNMDFEYGTYDMISFYGKHNDERMLQRVRVMHGANVISSTRGSSSHMHNPFAIICDKDANENSGEVWGFAFVYSGNFVFSASKYGDNKTRVLMGINPENFNYEIAPSEQFCTPEIAMVYSCEGFAKMTNCYHKAIRNNLCRGKYKTSRRPVLINNWEGTYFNFTGEKLVSMAKEAKKLGVELFVLDDGWFGKRDNDTTGLGDWYPNEKKLGCTLKELAEKINNVGLKFGLWFEPECISEDSDLYRAHPDYAFKMPSRKPCLSRHQYVLDMSRKEVRDNIYNQISKVLSTVNIEYVKWDFNRNITDLYCVALPKEKQGEVFHRYVLGVYELMERLTHDFPNVLFESCSGGGGRFDCGMHYYMPQAWTSDDTDPMERIKIQYGTSFLYPVCTMGAHVSASPNHQTARKTPLRTRGNVAYFGTYGLELDVTKMSDEEKEEIKRQISEFKELYEVIQNGNYYRIVSPFDTDVNYCAWEVASDDKSEAVVAIVLNKNESYIPAQLVKMKGLDPNKKYTVTAQTSCNGRNDGKVKYSGDVLMERGLYLDMIFEDYSSNLYHIKAVD